MNSLDLYGRFANYFARRNQEIGKLEIGRIELFTRSKIILGLLPLVFLTSCFTLQIPVLSSDEPASEIISNRISDIPITYSFDQSVVRSTGFGHIQQLSLQISPGPAIVLTLSKCILAAYPNAIAASVAGPTTNSRLYIYFTLDSFDTEFTYTRSFLDLSDTIHSQVSIGISVRIADTKNEDVYRGIIYGSAIKDEQSDTSRAIRQLSETTDLAIQILGDDFVQKVLLSANLAKIE